jgi:hypothetical protein
MSRIPLIEQLPSRFAASLSETERACLALVQTELEVAFSYLHAAHAENQRGNDNSDAAGISKALVTHNTVLKYLANVPGGRELY